MTSPSFGRILGLLKEPFDADVVVSREDKDRDAAPDRIEDTRDLSHSCRVSDGMLCLTSPRRISRSGSVASMVFMSRSRRSVLWLLKCMSMRGEIGLDPEMEVGNDEQALGVLDDKRRAVPDKLQFHNGFTYPFWGW